MSVTVTMSFASIEDAVSFLAGKPAAAATVSVQPPAPAPVAKATPAPTPAPAAPTPAPSAPTAEEPPVAAPAPRPLDFEGDVVEALKAYSKKADPAVFKAYMATLKVSKVNDLKSKPEMWPAIIAHCNG